MGMKGYFFTIDALIAVLLFITVMFALPTLYVDKKETTNLNYYSNDMIKVLSNLKVEEVTDPLLQELIDNGTVRLSNQSILEEAGRLWVMGYKNESGELVLELTEGLIGENTGLGLYISEQKLFTKDYPYDDYVVSAKHMVSGIEPGKPVTGMSSRAFINNVNEKSSSAYAFFGGFVGNGNISKKIFLPNSTDPLSAKMELDINSEFDLYINGNYSGTYNASAVAFQAEYFPINETYLSSFHNGENLITIGFSDTGLNYIGGGYLKVKYTTEDISSSDIQYYGDYVIDRYWFPGIKGVINLYSSFYIPGTVNSMNIYLHYLANHTLSFENDLILKLGSEEIFIDTNTTTEQIIYLNDSYLNSSLG